MASRSSPDLHRSFFALPLPPDVNRTVRDLIVELRRHDNETVRWTSPQNLHLTLRFLGELEDDLFAAAHDFLRSTSFGRRIHLQITGIDAFPSLRKPSILILAIQGMTGEDREALDALQRKTEEFARGIGLAPETRPFKPHITLGRVKGYRSVSSTLSTHLSSVDVGDFGRNDGEVESLYLMESLLRPEGPIYTVAVEAMLT